MSRVTVLTGGSTPERDVALAGAAQVVRALRGCGHEVSVADTVNGVLSADDEPRVLVPTVPKAPPSAAQLRALAAHEDLPALIGTAAFRDADAVFLVLHGRQGEGGEVQALLDLAGIPYTGSDALGSALAMDKDVTKRLLRDAGVPTPAWAMWPASSETVRRLGLPLIVKPSRAGSTVGLTVVRATAEIDDAVAVARAVDDEVMVEAFVPGRELTVGILDDDALAVGEIIPQHEIFDYECKYTPGMTREVFPADLPPALTARVRALARQVHVTLKLRDFSRVDFRLADDGTPLCLEVNTLPGVTATSLFPQSGAAWGVPFEKLCDRLVALTLRRRARGNNVSVGGK